MVNIACEFCQLKFDVDEGDVRDEVGELDGFACPDCGQTTYVPRIS